MSRKLFGAVRRNLWRLRPSEHTSDVGTEARTALIRGFVLVLLTWYLVVPPTDDNAQILKNRPIYQWHILASFKSQSGCEEAQKAYAQFFKCTPEMAEDIKRRKPPELKSDCSTMPNLLLNGQCLSSGDPRLKAPR